MADSNSIAPLTQAAQGKLGFFKAGVVKPVAMAAGAGGVGVLLGRFFTRKMFVKKLADGSIAPPNSAGQYEDADSSSKYKRGAVKIVAGLLAASAIRKWSAPAALGLAIGMGVDGVTDIVGAKVNEYLDKWFTPSTTTTTPATPTTSGAPRNVAGGRTTMREVGPS